MRELQNQLQRILLVGNGKEAIEELLSRTRVPPASTDKDKSPTLSNILEMLGIDNWNIGDGKPLDIKQIRKKTANLVEKNLISHILRKTGWNRSRAARILNISYKTLLLKIEMLKLEPPAELN